MNIGLALLGVPIDNVTMDEALDRMEGFIRERKFHQIATANINYLSNAVRDAEYRRILCLCDLVLADGMPLVWASRMFGVRLRERVTGADLVPRLAALSSRKGYRIFLLGAKPKVSTAAAARLGELFPGVQIAGRLSPPERPLEEFDNEQILREIELADPDILLVAFGSPKQEKWLYRNRGRLRVPVCVGVGGTLDFLANVIPRAPSWVQRAGMEWAFRIWAEPRRLARRYLSDALCMAGPLSVQLAASLTTRRKTTAFALALDRIGSINVLSVSGAMAGTNLAKLETVASSLANRGGQIVLELSAVTFIGADGIRTLANLLRDFGGSGRQLCLAGLTPALVRNLRASCFDGLVHSVPSVMDAIRKASHGCLQLNLELGEGWASCRINGEIPPHMRGTLEDICRRVMDVTEHFELDSSGAPDFDSSHLATCTASGSRVVFIDSPRAPAAGAA